MSKILVIGESCKDVFVYGKVERLEPAAPVPIVQTIRTNYNGGMAMNVKNNFTALGVDVDILTNESWESITKTRIVEHKTNHMFLRWDTGEDLYGRIDLKNVDYTKYSAIVISDYNKGYLSIDDIQKVCNSHDLVFLDTKKPIGRWCEGASFIKINKPELQNAKEVTDIIKERLIVTLGSSGASFRGELYPVTKTEVKDLSGAGDTFLAALCAYYCETRNIHESIKHANKCATMVVQKRGVSTI